MKHQFARLPAWSDERATTYVERGGELVTRHPFDLTGVRMYGFVVRADHDRLDELCERTFREPSGGLEDYVPVGSHVIVAFTEILSIQSSEAPDDGLGVCGEREVGVWAPVFDRRRDRACWTLPYLFVDQPAPMAGGREIFGFPKQLGAVTFPEPGDVTAVFGVSAPCIAHFDSAARMVSEPVLSARNVEPGTAAGARTLRPATPSGGRNRPWADPGEALLAMATPAGSNGRSAATPVPRLAADFAVLANELSRLRLTHHWIDAGRVVAMLASHLGFGRLPVVLLKQFRDVADPRRACYQAVVDVEHEVLRFDGGHLLAGQWQLEVADLDGEPLRRELGLPPTVPADLAFQLDFQFRIRAGQVLWEAAR
jgi:hypothetical protein